MVHAQSIAQAEDICIVGAGPGGAATALRLSYLGIPCTLIDRSTFPRDKVCGDALSGKVTTLLNRLDPQILERFRARFEPTDVWGIRFYPPNGRLIELPFQINYDRRPEAAPGYVSKRIDFDYFLIEEVRRRSNIDLELATPIKHFERTDTGWRIASEDGSFERNCKLLIVADGAHSHFSRHVAGLQLDPRHHAASVRTYFRGVTGFHPDNFIELHFLEALNPGYFWVFPLPNGLANVGLGIRGDIVRKRRLNLKQLFQEVLESETFRDRFANAEMLEPLKGYGLPLGSKVRTLSGDQFLLVGDAGHLIDPLTGEGIGNAFYSGYIAAELAERCFVENRFDADFLSAYDVRVGRVLRKEMRLSFQLQQIMQHRRITNLLTGFIADNPKLIEILCRMYTDFDLRKRLVRPSFWLALLLRKKTFFYKSGI